MNTNIATARSRAVNKVARFRRFAAAMRQAYETATDAEGRARRTPFGASLWRAAERASRALSVAYATKDREDGLPVTADDVVVGRYWRPWESGCYGTPTSERVGRAVLARRIPADA